MASKKYYYKPCKVCYLLDGDDYIKRVTFCKVCNEYLCEPCERNLIRRGLAMIKQKLQNNGST